MDESPAISANARVDYRRYWERMDYYKLDINADYCRILNFRDQILARAEGEPIEAIIIAPWSEDYPYGPMKSQDAPLDRIVNWPEVEAALDFEYPTGMLSGDLPAITAWTENWVIFVSRTPSGDSVASVPRLASRLHFPAKV